MKLQREGALAAFLVVVLLGGVAFDVLADDADVNRVVDAPSVFEERSVYCPPPPLEGASETTLVIAAAGGEAVPVGIADEDQTDLPAGRILTQRGTGSAAVVGYGGEILASALATFSGESSGTGAARCSKTASTHWYFAEGSSALGADERLVIYNPFPDEAVVAVTLFTPDGQQGNANLSEGIPVPARETTVIELNRYIQQQPAVGAAVVANRGRVIAWRAMQDAGEGRPNGVQFTLGATAPSVQWFFPEGAVDASTHERVSLLNPSEEEAVVTISLASKEQTVQPPELLEVVVPPRTLQRVALRDYVGGSDRNLGGAGVIIRTTSGKVVAERTVYYGSDAVTGTASEVGAARTSSEWYVGPAVRKPDRDHLVLLNPGAERVSVSLSLLNEQQGLLQPGALTDLTMEPGTQLRVALDRWTAGGIYSVRVEADGDVVAERMSVQGSEVGSVMGVPLVRPSEP